MNRKERRRQEKLRRKTGGPKLEAVPLLKLANQHHRAGRLNDAVVHYLSALDMDPDYAEAHYNLGIALKDLGQLDGAIGHYQKVLKIIPGHAGAHNNLGNALRDQGRSEDAIVCYHKALDLKPDYAGAHYNLGDALHELGRTDEAEKSYGRALEINPDLDDARHLWSAITGETTEIAPAGYVRKLFDDYAKRFDDHLTNKLGYKSPAVMRQVVDSVKDRPATFRRALDLGCGTGLVAQSFKEIVEEIAGIDLSPAMVEQARHKKIYSDLYLGDLCDVLEGPDIQASCYDLILSADTFVYIGNLAPVFAAVGKAISVGGLFVFSVESLEKGTYKLLPSGRYSQSEGYIRKLASNHGFSKEICHQVTVRTEEDDPIPGNIYLLRKTS